jgi:cobaltochelatase CobS
MSNVASAPAWQSYQVGTVVTVADGREFRITNIETRRTSGGYSSRLFTLEGPNGEVVVKTSRALTLWTQGKGSDEPSDLEAEATGSSKDLAALLAEAVSPYVTASASDTHGVDKAEVAKIVDERLAALVPQRIEVVQLDGTVNPVGVQHCHFEALLRIVACRLCAWLVGPAGSGKTSAAKSVADALTLPFYATSVGPQTSQSQLLGYYDANGAYVTTQLRQAYEHGGVFLLDEVDAGSAAVLVVINALLANGHAAFPDRVVERHADFVLLAGANTIGQGADRQYVGRQQADAATLDRFVALPWDYDPQIEAAACGVPFDVFSDAPKPKGRKFLSTTDRENVEERCAEYCRRVVSIRNAVEGLGKGVRFLCGPRASIHGCKLIRAGFTVKDTLDCCVWKGCDEDTRKKIEARC